MYSFHSDACRSLLFFIFVLLIRMAPYAGSITYKSMLISGKHIIYNWVMCGPGD